MSSAGPQGINVKSSIAGLADSSCAVKHLTVLVDLAADLVAVEDVVGRALYTDAVFPCLASEVVVNRCQELWVLVLSTQRSLSLRSKYLAQVHDLAAHHRCQRHQQANLDDSSHSNNKKPLVPHKIQRQ